MVFYCSVNDNKYTVEGSECSGVKTKTDYIGGSRLTERQASVGDVRLRESNSHKEIFKGVIIT